MALSAVSRGVYTVGLVVGKAALPIVVDIIANIAIQLLACRKISPNVRRAISTLPACTAVYLTSGVPKWDASSVITCCLYVFYKSLPCVARLKAAKPHPSIALLKTKYEQLMQRVTLKCDNRDAFAQIDFAISESEEVRKKWKEPETLRLAGELLNDAVNAMNVLYDDLEKAVASEPEELKFEKMAQLLTRQQGPHDYYSRFCSRRTVTLLDIYHTVRALGYALHLPRSRLHFSIAGHSQWALDDDVKPFYTLGTDQNRWREAYNAVMGRFAPLLRTLDANNEKFTPYLAWAVKDEQMSVANSQPGAKAFQWRPCDKPA